MSKTSIKRMRVFAGPNGSGKSTLAKNLRLKHSVGVFVNADEIEVKFRNRGSLSLYKYKIYASTKCLQKFIKNCGMSGSKLNNSDIYKSFSVIKNNIYFNGKYSSYIAADVAEYIRQKLIKNGHSFSFETVFSHESKLEIMQQARKAGFRVYFYFITTDDPEININRVNIRVAQNGHFVPPKKICDRYSRSLELMLPAVKISSRAYLFDNSGKYYQMVAEVENGKQIEVLTDFIPQWFVDYFYNKIYPE